MMSEPALRMAGTVAVRVESGRVVDPVVGSEPACRFQNSIHRPLTHRPIAGSLRQVANFGVVELQIELRDEGIPLDLTHTVRAASRGEVTVDPQHPEG